MGEGERNYEVRFFPFSAVVGQEKAKLALLCVAVNPLIGGVLLRGDKGTGKTTLVRALANILPEIEVVRGCPFNCNPRNPLEMCDACRKEERHEIAVREMKVVDLPLSITVDRLVGTINVEDFLREGRRALQPGVLAEANRNILYIDEVNLLDDYIADSLLDAAATGWNVIEREGISFRHPARFILIGSMNPEEGELRPQILDRFGLCVEISAPMNPEERMEIVRRVEEFHRDPAGFWEKFRRKERELTEKVLRARELLPEVEMGEELLKLLTDTVIKLGIKTNRAEIACVKTAKAIAALEGRRKVSLEDLERAMELALPHRLREKPFQKPQTPNPPPPEGSKKEGGELREERKEGGDRGGNPKGGEGNLEEHFPSNPAEIPKIEEPKFRGEAGTRCSREGSVTVIDHPRGIQISHVPAKSEAKDLDLYNSCISAILQGKKPPLKLGRGDLQVRVRRTKVQTLWVLILDSSGSMSVGRRISAAKGIAQKLCEDGYVRKSKMAFILARGRKAELLVPPTRNYERVFEMIEAVPTGGRTPLSSALYELLLLSEREKMRDRSLKVRAFLVTDGRANISLFGKPIREELVELLRALGKEDVELTVFSADGGLSPGISYIQLFALILGALCPKAPAGKTVKITDSLGREVEVPENPQKVVILNSDAGEAMVILGLEDRVVGITDSIKEEGMLRQIIDKPSVGRAFTPNIEKILELQPDIVITYGKWPKPEKLEEKLSGTGIAVVRLDFYKPQTFERDFRELSKIFGAEERAENFLRWRSAALKKVEERTEEIERKVKVFPRSADPNRAWKTYGVGSSTDEGITLAGGYNISSELEGAYPTASPEWVVAEDPDVVILCDYRRAGYTLEDPQKLAELVEEAEKVEGLKETKAVREGRVYLIANDLLGGSQTFIGVLYLAKWFYPEKFEDISPEEVHREYFERWLRIPYKGLWVYPS